MPSTLVGSRGYADFACATQALPISVDLRPLDPEAVRTLGSGSARAFITFTPT